MTVDTFIAEAKRHLSPILANPGSVLFSSVATLSKAYMYILGLNPGGAGGKAIEEHLNALPRQHTNAYLDDCWESKTRKYQQGQAPLQQRLKWRVEKSGYDIRTVCASNLVFKRSPSALTVELPEDADVCWPVHEQMLSILQPKLILAFGNGARSPYRYMLGKLGNEEETVSSGHGNWKVRGFEAEICKRKIFVVGLPHLSRYSPIDRTQIVEWMRNRIDG